MRQYIVTSILAFAAFLAILPNRAFSQASGKPPQPSNTSDQELREISLEIRLLRAELQRINLNAHRSQVLLDRIRIQQEEVIRLRRDVNDVHDKLEEVRAQQVRAKEAIKLLKKLRDPEVEGPDDNNMNEVNPSVLNSFKALGESPEELDSRQRVLAQRESALATDLELAQARLSDLNTRLDEIEREMAQPLQSNDCNPPKRQQ